MKIKYCLPIIKFKKKDVLKTISENQNLYEFFEVWLDYIQDLDLNFVKNLEKNIGGRIIFLLRRQNLEIPKMDLKKRVEIINLLANSKSLLDLDIFSQKKELEYLKKNPQKNKVIVSYHNYDKTPVDKKLKEIVSLMKKNNPYIYKISAFCKSDSDALRLIDFLALLKDEGFKCIILGMGTKGTITRIAGAILGNEINFAPVSARDKSAPGQLTRNELEEILKTINTCYFIADPVQHSLSPQMHNAGYKALGIENDFIFLRRRIKSKDLSKFINRIKKEANFRGASISIPHKVAIMKNLDRIDGIANKIGAVNTIVKRGQELKGYNTDYLGILNPLKKILSAPKNKKAAVVGAGGAARAAVYALITLSMRVTIFNRDVKKAQKLAEEFNCDFDSLKNISRISDFDVVIHATKIGLNPSDAPIIPKKNIRANQLIFDVVYSKDSQTKLISEAIEQKAVTISGIEMLLYQGIAQFELFTGRAAPVKEMREALL